MLPALLLEEDTYISRAGFMEGLLSKRWIGTGSEERKRDRSVAELGALCSGDRETGVLQSHPCLTGLREALITSDPR